MHVTWRVVAGLPSLRSRRAYRVIRDAFNAAAKRFGMTLCEFSVQSNHVHLVVEAAHRPALSKALQALGVRLARRLNRVFERRGRLLSDRFHAHVLRTPREVRNAVRYVRTNHLHHHGVHAADARTRAATMFPGPLADPFSSSHVDNGVLLRFPRTWLLRGARNALALPP